MTSAARPSDDSFHRPASADPFWTETAWFGFAVPERRLCGAVYPLFRPNQGVCSSGVYVWDDRAETAHDLAYARTSWHLPMPTHDLTQLSLPTGLRYECLEPLRRYRVSYRDGDELELDLLYEGVHAPYAPLVGDRGHVDQYCHVTGSMVLHGERIEVDCHEMRDRSWGVRRDDGQVRAGYDYGGAGGHHAFLAVSTPAGDEEVVLAGFHLRDGELAAITGGHRTVGRVDGRPDRVTIEATDADGRELLAEGTCLSRFAFQSSPSYFAWMSLTRWSLDGSDGWGQDQDVWSPDLWRAARRQALAATQVR